jgi:hypothetical protein
MNIEQRLVAALEALERETTHDRDCISRQPHWQDLLDGVERATQCSCSFGERLRLAIAQRIETFGTDCVERGASLERYLGYSEVTVNRVRLEVEAATVAAFASPGRDT